MNIQQRLRDMCERIRRTPVPIADVIPMLQQAADEIDTLIEKDGLITFTHDLDGRLLAVTRTDNEHRIKKILWEADKEHMVYQKGWHPVVDSTAIPGHGYLSKGF